MIKVSNKILFLAILIVFLATLGVGWYVGQKRANNAITPIVNALTGKIKVYQYKIDSLTKIAYEKEQLIITQKQALETGLIKQKELKALNLKKVNEVTMLKAQVRLLLDSIQPDHPVIIVNCDTVIDQPVLYLPVEFDATPNEFYELKVSLNHTAEMSIDLKVPVVMDLWTGYDRKLKNYKAVVTSNNPYFKVSEIRSIKVEPKKPFYNKTWFKVVTFGSAFAAGVLIAK